MDPQTAALIAVTILALVVIFVALRYRGRLKADITGPLGTRMSVDASNPERSVTPGVRVQGARSQAGGLHAADRTGRGADVKDVETYGDISVTSEPHPKADPPA